MGVPSSDREPRSRLRVRHSGERRPRQSAFRQRRPFDSRVRRLEIRSRRRETHVNIAESHLYLFIFISVCSQGER